ncbi:thiocillin family RiPP [Spiractinospora alimapuensis]|uniref:thiocillin family RiPP n=1 Tax=Spiractinospora alimapuensis TaxID=2820884 RepID=UPI001F2AC758|nr:thiocillin family RiPP [Spiractinospora alimapuensis]QVQ50241.1 thiocillin family RiPP [Spiractinospora alimapuensis]
MNSDPLDLDLYATDDDLVVEALPEGSALNSFSSAATASSASCPATSASSLTSSTSFSC